VPGALIQITSVSGTSEDPELFAAVPGHRGDDMKKRGKKIAQPAYLRKIAYLWRIGALPREAGYHQVTVEHDDWCAHWQQEICNCNPDVRLKFSLSGHAHN